MAARTPLLKLTEVTWGDRVHLAYRQARAKFGRRDPKTRKATFSYDVIATKLTDAGFPCTDQVLMRLEDYDDIPDGMRQRQVAYLALLAYGFDPADFGLTPDNVALTAFDMPKIKRVLAPTFSWTPRRAAA